MFHRYTESARRVIFFGRGEASEFGTGSIESEHLLLGLLQEDPLLVVGLVKTPGLLATIRTRVQARFAPGPKTPVHVDMPMSLAAQQVLAYASEEAERLNDNHIAPAHLLLGLLRDQESIAAEIFREHGIGSEEVRNFLALQYRGGHLKAPEGTPPEAGMIQMITGFWVSRAIYTAAKLGLADLMKGGPKSVDELAAATGSNSASLYRMLRALGTVGVFKELGNGRFETTPLASTLEDGRPGTLRYFVMAELGQEHYSAWEEFPYSVRTGGLAFTEKFKQPVWEYYAAHKEDAEVFNRSMSTLTEWVTQAILSAYDFSAFKKIVDIGGGQGALLAAMLGKATSARGVLFDAAPVIAEAARLKEAGLADRTEQISGNFFEAVPAGGDLYTLKMILHDWNDQDCATILANIRKAIVPGGRIAIVETVLGDGPDAPMKNFLDLNMMVMTGGRERTEPEYRGLLEGAGFTSVCVIPTQSPMSIVEGIAK